MTARDWAKDEYPISKDPYPGRRRVRQTGWYLKLSSALQLLVCSISSGSSGRLYRRMSCAMWMKEMRGFIRCTVPLLGDKVTADVLADERNAAHQRERAAPRRRQLRRRRAEQARLAYARYRADIREQRRELMTLESARGGEALGSPEDLSEEVEALRSEIREACRSGFSRERLEFDANGWLRGRSARSSFPC